MGTEDLPVQMASQAREILHDMRTIAAEKLAPIAAEGTPGHVNRPLLRALSEHGILPRLFPRELGGSEEGEVSAAILCLLREGLAQGSTEAETALALQGLGSYPIVRDAN
ncbi:MAG: acyl-CoA dehydrogenase, partial [Actinomycetota bacterium]|nr:acyl-CoA dehydrogenase [Actinomycetota bacterium]